MKCLVGIATRRYTRYASLINFLDLPLMSWILTPFATHSEKTMNVWIDIDNLPNVPFFDPIIREFKQRGHRVFVTARDHAQLLDLLKLHSIDYIKIGRHYGKNKLKKIIGGAIRSLQLSAWSVDKRIDIAVGFVSRSLALACFLRGIPNVTAYDYEYVSIRLLNKWVSKVIVPDAISGEFIVKHGATRKKIVQFPGYKEEIYVGRFTPFGDLLQDLGIDSSQIIVTMRPPAILAHYHNNKSEVLFDELVNIIGGREKVTGIIFPRTKGQIGEFETKKLKNVSILKRPVNGLELIWNSDIVVSGGGTMIREAAVLGVPAYSIFTGRQGAVDKKLTQEGKIVFLRELEDLQKIEFKKTENNLSFEKIRKRSDFLTKFFVNEILGLRDGSNEAAKD